MLAGGVSRFCQFIGGFGQRTGASLGAPLIPASGRPERRDHKDLMDDRAGGRSHEAYGEKPKQRHTEPATKPFGTACRTLCASRLASPFVLSQWVAL